jgi:antitoxin (DNA-binding transcriptional repressor) of toxin-antitoxin stability system
VRLKSVNIRALKDKLSAYLRDVQHGDVFLITDRGRVVAELRQPTMNPSAIDSSQNREQALVDRGVLTVGLPHDPAAYRAPRPRVRLADAAIDEALDWTRGEK